MTRVEDLNPSQIERFQRHLGLAGFGPEAQCALLDARVAVIGAGGLGAPILQYLGAAGVGHIDIVDDDVVDRSNLHRQVIHRESDIGRPKASSAADVVHGLHPEAEVTERRIRLTKDNALDVLREADLVLDGSDNFLTRYIVSDAAEILGKPVVYGAILRFEGQISVFWSGHGPTYRDLFPEPPAPGEVPSCAEAGVIGVLPGVVGTLMATEAIKVLTGIGEPLLGRVLVYDALAASFRELRLSPDPGREPVTSVVPDLQDESDGPLCAVPSETAEAEAISAAELRELLERGEGLTILDVREPWEHRLGAIPGAVNIPLGEIDADPEGVAAASVPSGRPTVVYCKAGVRSRRAQDLLVGVLGDAQIRSLTGGYDAWDVGAPTAEG